MAKDPNDYAEMRREEKKHSWSFAIAFLAFLFCLGTAMDRGPAAGWKWLLGALAAPFVAMWSFIEYRYYSLEIRLHLLPGEVRDAMNEADDE